MATGSNSKGQCGVSGWANVRVGGESDSAIAQSDAPAPATEPTEQALQPTEEIIPTEEVLPPEEALEPATEAVPTEESSQAAFAE